MTAQFVEQHTQPMNNIIYYVVVEDELLSRIFIAQKKDDKYEKMVRKAKFEGSACSINEQDQIRYQARIWVPSDGELKNDVLAYLHNTQFSMNPGGIKIQHG